MANTDVSGQLANAGLAFGGSGEADRAGSRRLPAEVQPDPGQRPQPPSPARWSTSSRSRRWSTTTTASSRARRPSARNCHSSTSSTRCCTSGHRSGSKAASRRPSSRRPVDGLLRPPQHGLARAGRHRADLRGRLQQLPVRHHSDERRRTSARELGRAHPDERHPRSPPRHRGAEAEPGDRRDVDHRRAGPITESAAPATARTMEVVITYEKDNGNPIARKELAVDTQGRLGVPGRCGPTDANGQVTMVLTRTFVGDAGRPDPGRHHRHGPQGHRLRVDDRHLLTVATGSPRRPRERHPAGRAGCPPRGHGHRRRRGPGRP